MSARFRKWEPLSFEHIETVSLHDRPSKVRFEDFGKPWNQGDSLASFLGTLPKILAAGALNDAIEAMGRALDAGRTVLLGMGAHPIKVGLSPVLIDAIDNGLITGLALNGAGVIHDVELALSGKTSEDVAGHLNLGRFGMARETAEFIHSAVREGYRRGDVGLGRAVGEKLLREQMPYEDASLLCTAVKRDVPITVHVAFGTDIIHMHPGMNGAEMGALTHHDFRVFCRQVSGLEGGVYVNLGSAVILPEVFLKAVSVVANLGHRLDGITTINMDFQKQYRSQLNVVERPTAGRGRGISLIGHHEIMLPLLMAGLKEKRERRGKGGY